MCLHMSTYNNAYMEHKICVNYTRKKDTNHFIQFLIFCFLSHLGQYMSHKLF